MTEDTLFTVIKVIDDFRVVINAGSKHGISAKSQFIVFELGENLIDPDTKEDLGQLEIVKGTGRPLHIQEKFCTIESDRRQTDRTATRRTIKRGGNLLMGLQEVEEVTDPGTVTDIPFQDPKEGDKAKLMPLSTK